MKKSILKKAFLSMLGFGLIMGLVFPVYANFFVIWKEKMLLWFVSGCILAGLSVGIISFFITKIIIIKQLTKIAHISKKVSKKDLSVRLDIESEDIIGEIVNSFNLTIDSYNNTLEDMRKKSDTLNNIIVKLTSSSNSLNDSSTLQSKSTDKIVNDVEDVRKSLTSINEKSLDATASLKNILANIENKLYLIKNLKNNMENLENSGKEIETITSFIKSISFKSNILAINASVEAAKAGEVGRGFAVVAGEVRNLSKQTSDSSKNIDSLLADNKSLINNGLTISKETTEFFLSLKSFLDDIDTSFNEISESINSQVKNFNNLNANIENLKTMVENNIGLSNDLNIICDTINENSKELYKSVKEFSLL